MSILLSFDWALYFKWIMATTVGWLLGRFLFPNLAFIVLGIAIGVLQGFILQSYLSKFWNWTIATSLGWALGSSVILVGGLSSMDLIAALLVGMTTGTAQWLVLRKELHWSGWWIMISIVAWTSGMVLLPGIILTGVVAGAVTGIALVLLVRFPNTETLAS
jgi:hypothetical protein